MNNEELYNETNRATYCPESNTLHLYVGRVPRDEYLALKAEGWRSTPKQSEAGGGEFAATWTPARRDTALSYAGIIEDEDQGPAERAADRAERFGGYLEKRLDEATGHADKYDAGPSAHGFQSKARAVRAADRHDRIATRATDAWSKAEYWQQRTAGVISHALHLSAPSVRMGRIKEIEADIRRIEAGHRKAYDEHATKHAVLLSIAEHAAGTREKLRPAPFWQYSVDYIRKADGLENETPLTPEQMRRVMILATFSSYSDGKWSELRKLVEAGTMEAAEVARQWLDAYGWDTPTPFDFTKNEWHQHLSLRLAYENQMIEAAGGRAGAVEMEVGGWLRGGRRLSEEFRQIVKVNKSPKTGRVVSVEVKDNYPSSVNHWGNAYPDGVTKTLIHPVKVERMDPDAYRAPTEDEREAYAVTLAASKKARKATAPKAPPLINPTMEDAERLQAALNDHALADHCARYLKAYGRDYADQFKPSTVCLAEQAYYSARSKGSYASAETRGVMGNAKLEEAVSYCNYKPVSQGVRLCEVRTTRSDGSDYGARRVIVLTDKPQKPLPKEVWEPIAAPAPEAVTA